jgi:hypothetical protein
MTDRDLARQYDSPLLSPIRAWQGWLWWALYGRMLGVGGARYFIRFHRRPVARMRWAKQKGIHV